MKVFLIIISIILVLIGLIVGAGFWWWSSNEESIRQQAEQAAEQVMEVAQSGDSFSCVAAQKKRVNHCSDLTCQVGHQIFIQECLAKATYNPKLCEAVNEAGFTEWAGKQCGDKPADLQACIIAMNGVSELCAAQ